jgi:hypothetical protein
VSVNLFALDWHECKVRLPFVRMSKTCELFVRMSVKFVGLCEDECKSLYSFSEDESKACVTHVRASVKLVCLVRGKVQSL